MKPSLWKLLKNDYLALLAAIFGPVALGIGGYVAVTGSIPRRAARGGEVIVANGVDLPWLIGASILAIVLFFVLYRRFAHIKHVLANGNREQATILDVSFFKDRGRVEFEYAHGGQTYRTGTAIMKNRQTLAFQPNDVVEIALDPADPAKAYITELYLA